MKSRRFRERFKEKASYVARDGKLTITPENFIHKFPIFSTQCHRYDDTLALFSHSLKTSPSPTPVSQKNLNYFNGTPDNFGQDRLGLLQNPKLTVYKPGNHLIIKKTRSFVEQHNIERDSSFKELQERYNKEMFHKYKKRLNNFSQEGRRVWPAAGRILEKKKTFSGKLLMRQDTSYRGSPIDNLLNRLAL